MGKLTYKILDNGYQILKDDKVWIEQVEPFIPDNTKSYEENAKAQIEELLNPPTPEPNEMDIMKEEILNTQLALTEVYEMLLGGAQ